MFCGNNPLSLYLTWFLGGVTCCNALNQLILLQLVSSLSPGQASSRVPAVGSRCQVYGLCSRHHHGHQGTVTIENTTIKSIEKRQTVQTVWFIDENRFMIVCLLYIYDHLCIIYVHCIMKCVYKYTLGSLAVPLFHVSPITR